MKNYVQLWYMADVDTSVPTVIQFGFFESLIEAQTYANDNPVAAPEKWMPPQMYYFLLNKSNLTTIIAQFPWNRLADGSLGENQGVYTQDDSLALGWNTESPLFTTDTSDPASVKARKTASKILKAIPSIKTKFYVWQFISLAAAALLLERTAEAHSVGNELNALATANYEGKVSDVDAMAEYNKIVALHPTLFGR